MNFLLATTPLQYFTMKMTMGGLIKIGLVSQKKVWGFHIILNPLMARPVLWKQNFHFHPKNNL